MSLANSSWSQSFSSSISFDHVQGCTPLPSIQCLNIALQHASELWGYFSSISSSFELLLSKSKRSPRSVHLAARRLMMLIIFRSLADFRTFKVQIVNSQSRCVCTCVCVVAQVIKLISLCHPTILYSYSYIVLYQTIILLVHESDSVIYQRTQDLCKTVTSTLTSSRSQSFLTLITRSTIAQWN